ncbi:oncoprotein-induced transcript 3 protein-like [Exaiptasia diaphana]|uniref:Apple domain-containing protein n=1 Tax=Exaiptasia diaphana TaxID=2652724 RepID=A0A913YIY5_EXADI|nr:oncoprotein-induced transcript 3 protein-like [Exaiptasia diaphana]
MSRCQERNEVYSACLQNTLREDHSRSVEYDVGSGHPSDRETFIRRRWYRIQNKKAARIVTSCPAPGSCGAKAPGWLNGQYPSLEAGIKEMEICYNTGADCCGRNATVYVRQCYGYPVFMFDNVPEKSLGNRVCIELDAEIIYPEAMFQSTHGQCLSNHVMHSENNMADVFICIQHCLHSGEKCKSINFMDNNGTCHLNNASEADYPKHKIVEAYCTYFQRIAVASAEVKVSN